ncbi:ribonucleotide reductase inhibitor-domain-containing protein [Pseudomassariella vexata]|uniref:Ribonucleotide reductase inhibitor-domain-containing protein n=1 Tax=Pseudomassariella vexata TaxID=1141098 RepID=A0A1Y2DMU9_9PEZI|nr:ribonucleotide reductase inhibitor-domain-containing protein [Pseudomassariella vexata]ORY60499.1 ribonucleotide reductase inhibitor-domain-containing protein [Pseudomassariella vexata]
MSAPRTKRQFAGAASDPAQRQITSFFTSSSSSSPPSFGTSTPTTPRFFDASESTIQSNLLSVGMRVRKAVPEGYKTGCYSAFALWDDNNTTASNSTTMQNNSDVGRSRANAISAPRELTPFCGIHRIGGMAVQPPHDDETLLAPLPNITIDHVDKNMDYVPGLTLSQESAVSTDSNLSASNSRKRFFTEDEDENETASQMVPGRLNLNFAQLPSWEDGQVSPRSLTPTGWANSRVFAQPRKRGVLQGKPTDGALGQENVMIVDEDFEEASFLVEMRDAQ